MTLMKSTTTALAMLFCLLAIQLPAQAEEPATANTGMVNINTASAEQLAQLDGVGESKAKAIVANREANGPFESESDLTRVQGIGDATVDKNAGRITTR